MKKILQNRQWRGEIHAKVTYYFGETYFRENSYQDALNFYERAFFGFKKFPRYAMLSCKRAVEVLNTLQKPQKAKDFIKELVENEYL